MDSTLSHEEFERMQNQLLALKTSNYSYEEQNRRNNYEINSLKAKNEELEKQLLRSQTVAKINPMSLARNIANKVDNRFRDKELDQLLAENESLVRKIESQEEEFKVTNNTLKSEITSLMTINETLEQQLKSLHNNRYVESQPECDLGINVDNNVINDDNNVINNNRAVDQQNVSYSQNQLSFAILAEKEKLEIKVNELQDLNESLRKENELISAQMEEMEMKCDQKNELQTELKDCNNLIDRQNSLIEEMRAHKIEIELKFKSNSNKLVDEYVYKLEQSEIKLKNINENNQMLNNCIHVLKQKLQHLQNVNKDNEKLINELHSYKEELTFCKTQCEETVESIKRENVDKIDKLLAKHELQCDDYKNRIYELESETKQLSQQILDGIEERKIHDKKGVAMVKELKKQLHSERKRAQKLQEKLEQVLNESTSTLSNDIQRKQSTSYNSNNNGNDSSSVGSWSFMSSKDNFNNNHTSSLHSGSDGTHSPIAPINSSIVQKNETLLEQENTELVTRITSLQQQKWVLEEKVNQLELSNKDMAQDIVRKTEIIEFYCIEGRSHRSNLSQSLLHNSDKLTVKRVVDFIKDKGDENMREINRKVQRMLEETLTKNIHLQQNLEIMSNENLRLNTLIQQLSDSNHSKDK